MMSLSPQITSALIDVWNAADIIACPICPLAWDDHPAVKCPSCGDVEHDRHLSFFYCDACDCLFTEDKRRPPVTANTAEPKP